MELFEQIRREYEFGVGSIVGVSKKLGVHRRMVREAIGSAVPKSRKRTERPRWKLKAAVEFIDAVLEADRKAPRKQRHTAHRIWARIQSEVPDCKIAERTVREYVHDRKVALGLISSRNACSAKLQLGCGSADRLVRSLCRSRRSEDSSCKCLRCAVWQAEPRFTARTCMRLSKHF